VPFHPIEACRCAGEKAIEACGLPPVAGNASAKCRRNWMTAALDALRGLGYQGTCEASLQHEGALMAIDPSGGHPAMDYTEHTRTYSGFLRATVIMIALVVVILLYLLSLVP
jgi:hypothetical protein